MLETVGTATETVAETELYSWQMLSYDEQQTFQWNVQELLRAGGISVEHAVLDNGEGEAGFALQGLMGTAQNHDQIKTILLCIYLYIYISLSLSLQT